MRKYWDPGAYARFSDLRLRPALDLLAQVPDVPAGDIVDLGCGAGAVAPALAHRFAGRTIIGVDASEAMLGTAREGGHYGQCVLADAGEWQPQTPPALIFSNALLHWLPDHGALMRRLARHLAPGGVLAVQMPRQHGAPSHRFLRDFAAEMFPHLFDFSAWEPAVLSGPDYARMLAGLGTVDVWETDYIQRLAPQPGAHPVRRFTESTVMRPFAEKLDPDLLAALIARYEGALNAAYPPEADGAVLFPFRRLFFVLKV